MRFFIIDYSEIHYKSKGKDTPPARRRGKFIQIRKDKTEYLVLSPGDFTAYHANIAEKFFSQNEIEGTYNNKRDHYEIRNPDWDIVGGGMWSINEKEKRRIRLFNG
ncbi:MAG: hypothetical protein AB1632_15005 [Nitrospirota bacterium]